MHNSAMLNCLCKTLFFKLYVPFLSKIRTWRQSNKRKKGAFINSVPKFRIRMKTCIKTKIEPIFVETNKRDMQISI